MFAPAPTLEALAERVRPMAASRTRLLPVAGCLAPLLPDGGLRRGSVVQCAGVGSRHLVLALLAEASVAGSWCAFVGAADLGVVSAAEHGVALSRLAVVRAVAAEWAVAAGRLVEGIDLVVVVPPPHPRPAAVRRLVARTRHAGTVLLIDAGATTWPDPPDVRLEAGEGRWLGLDRGAGRLGARRVTVVARGKGAANRPVESELWLPTATGSVAAA
jgi:hypothetical protein